MAVTAEDIENVISSICKGISLRSTLELHAVDPSEFFKVVFSNAAYIESYERAQKTRAEILADEIVEISDTEPDPQKARVRTESRKWYASKMQPQKYGDRLDLNLSGTVDINAALNEAKARLLPGRYHENTIEGELVETKRLSTYGATGSEPVASPQLAEKIETPNENPPSIFD